MVVLYYLIVKETSSLFFWIYTLIVSALFLYLGIISYVRTSRTRIWLKNDILNVQILGWLMDWKTQEIKLQDIKELIFLREVTNNPSIRQATIKSDSPFGIDYFIEIISKNGQKRKYWIGWWDKSTIRRMFSHLENSYKKIFWKMNW